MLLCSHLCGSAWGGAGRERQGVTLHLHLAVVLWWVCARTRSACASGRLSCVCAMSLGHWASI